MMSQLEERRNILILKLVLCFSSSLPPAQNHSPRHRVCLSLPAVPASVRQDPEEHVGAALHWRDQRLQVRGGGDQDRSDSAGNPLTIRALTELSLSASPSSAAQQLSVGGDYQQFSGQFSQTYHVSPQLTCCRPRMLPLL